MKEWMRQATMSACAAAVVAVCIGCFGYRQLMGDVYIVQYFDSISDNLDWQAVRIRAVVPEDRYRKGWTEDAIRMYVIIRSRNIPDRIDIVLYGSMEKFEECEEYAEATFEK